MSVVFENLYRKDPLYFCWKRALNTLMTRDPDKLGFKYKAQYREGYVISVDIEFASEADYTWFLLRWS